MNNAAKMDLKSLLLFCFQLSARAAAQSISRDTLPNSTIVEILSAHSQLSSLLGLINSISLLVQQLNSADNFIFLAPTNEALSTWLATNPSSDYVEATLQYHLLNGTYASQSIPSTPVFIATALTNPSYCNMTGGQRVKASNKGYLAFDSGLNTTSSSLGLTTVSEKAPLSTQTTDGLVRTC
jgi:uncharacterized surface protein with fasciclin (FAS1) repeats